MSPLDYILLLLLALALAAVAWLLLARSALIADRAQALAQADAAREALGREQSERRALEAKAERLSADTSSIRLEAERLRTQLDASAQMHAQRVREIADLQEQFKAHFKALSADALRVNREDFLKHARETFEGVQKESRKDDEARQKAIDEMVKPVRESLAKYETKLESIEKDRAAAHAALGAQVKTMSEAGQALREETGRLVKALGKPGIRGRWGELTLRRVVELAGMSAHCDFSEQVVADVGRLRPDLIVHLPGECQIVVDAKAPLDGYLAAMEAQTDADRALHLARHVEHVRAKVAELSHKRYWEQFPRTPEFVIMFVPGESFLEEALRQDPALLERSVAEGVVIATPLTLISLLKAVSYGWQQQRLADNAQAVIEVGREMHNRLAILADHLTKVGDGLQKAVASYNDFVGSFERNALSQARRFEELSVRSSKPLAQPESLDLRVREIRSAPSSQRLLSEDRP